jgi:hypothetical protein
MMMIITNWMRYVRPRPAPAPRRKESAGQAALRRRRGIDEQIMRTRDWEQSQRMLMGARLR